jgi:hypothetical protein
VPTGDLAFEESTEFQKPNELGISRITEGSERETTEYNRNFFDFDSFPPPDAPEFRNAPVTAIKEHFDQTLRQHSNRVLARLDEIVELLQRDSSVRSVRSATEIKTLPQRAQTEPTLKGSTDSCPNERPSEQSEPVAGSSSFSFEMSRDRGISNCSSQSPGFGKKKGFLQQK